MNHQHLRHRLRTLVRQVPGFPQPGIVFEDITPLLADATALRDAVELLVAPYRGRVDLVAGIEARGFILGGAAAVALGVGFVPLRKAGKLPAPTRAASYLLEYGEATLEMHLDAVRPHQRVLVVDDVVATGGTARAGIDLIQGAGAAVVGLAALLEIPGLEGRALLEQAVEVHVALG